MPMEFTVCWSIPAEISYSPSVVSLEQVALHVGVEAHNPCVLKLDGKVKLNCKSFLPKMEPVTKPISRRFRKGSHLQVAEDDAFDLLMVAETNIQQ